MVLSKVKSMQSKPVKLSFSKSWLIWGCAALFYCYQFMLRVSPSVMADDLMSAFQIDACTLGMLTGAYYYTYSAVQFPGGVLMDLFKPRRVLTAAAVVCSAGTFLFSMADSLYIAFLGRALIGAGSAVGFLSCFKIGSLWFPAHKLSFVVGLTILLGTIGGVSAGYPLAWLVEIYGWRHTLWFISFIGFALAAFAWLLVRDMPPENLRKAILKSHGDSEISYQSTGFWTNIIEVVRKPQSWLLALFGFLMYIPLSGVTDIWGPPFLIAAYNLDKTTAGAVNSALYVGMGIGSPFFPLLLNFLKAYKPTIFIAAIGALVMLSVVYYVPGLPLWLLTGCLFLAGLFLSGQFLAFSMVSALNPLSASGTAGGFQNGVCMISGIIFQPFLGWLLDFSWAGAIVNGARVYTISEYTFAFTSIVIALFLACLCIIPIKERY